MTKDWCILEMTSQRTLRVVRSLAADGFEVWAPVMNWRRRRPRSTKFHDIELAVMPGFAFARYADLPQLCAVLASPTLASQHPPFSIMRYQDEPLALPDDQLQGLRAYEAAMADRWRDFLDRERRKGNRARRYVLGQRVRLPNTAFEGLDAEVVEIQPGKLVLRFSGFPHPVTVDSCAPEPVQLKVTVPEYGMAARAA